MNRNVSKTSLEKPLLGAVLCCTSVSPEDRTRLAEYAEQMGAEHKLDLTSDVTHLLVGSTDTPKYQYVAREREDVKVLRPEWVEAVRQCWMEDRPLDMNALEAEYKVPTLAGLKICITGFPDLNFRAQLQKNVTANGGEYTGDLTKNATHLIAAKPEGMKYEHATLWQKKVVTLQWYKDTLERGMQLDEARYHPTRPADEQGVGAWNRAGMQQSALGKRSHEEEPTQEPTRKLRRTASAKLSSQSENMWGDIVGQPVQQAENQQALLRSTKSMSALREQAETPTDPHGEQSNTRAAALGSGFLSGLHFAVSKFDSRKETLVHQTLEAAGAIVLSSVADLAKYQQAKRDNTYIIVPHQTRNEELPQIGKSSVGPNIVTELWLERCMLQKSLISPTQYPLGGLITRINNPDIGVFAVNATGFQSIETLHIAKTVALTGAQYAETFTPKSSVLVCNSLNINQQKLFHAKQWKVPAVSEAWLCRFLIEGAIPPFKNYLIEGYGDDDNDLEAELKQRRGKRDPRRPPDDSVGDRDSFSKPLVPRRPGSTGSATEPSRKSSSGQRDHKQHQESRNRSQSNAVAIEDSTLREISPNSPTKRNKSAASPTKKALSRTYDGSSSIVEDRENDKQMGQQPDTAVRPTSPAESAHDAASINTAIQDLLNMKARAKANAATNQDETKSKKKRLLGRALSNLSNASRTSRQSRASSVDSLNTDGLGSEIAPPSARSIEGFSKNSSTIHKHSIQGHARSKASSASALLYYSAPIDLSDPHLLRDEFEAQPDDPQLTQLGYEDSEEALALREQLAEKRRARARLGQNPGDPPPEIGAKEREAIKAKQRAKEKEKQVIKDDEMLNATGWGGGRRTRAKNRSIDTGDLDLF